MLPYLILACTLAWGGDAPAIAQGAIVSWEALVGMVLAMLGIFGAPMAKVLMNQTRMSAQLNHMDAMMGEVKVDVKGLHAWKEGATLAISKLEWAGDPPTGA
jgi:hypothetical protein